MGPPARSVRGTLRWCLDDGGKLIGVFRRGTAVLVLTTSRAFEAAGVRVGTSERVARRAFRGERRLERRGRGLAVLDVPARGRRLLVGLRGKRVSFLAVAPKRSSDRTVDRDLGLTR